MIAHVVRLPRPAIGNVGGLSAELQKSFSKKQGEMSRFRHAMAHYLEAAPSTSAAIAPERRAPQYMQSQRSSEGANPMLEGERRP
jgi:hypothetical protein